MIPKVAYISSEFALSDDLPTYAGGLGILAADMLYQAAESSFPLCGMSVFYKEGFFQQKIDPQGEQKHFYEQIDPEKAGLADTGEMIEIPVVDHSVKLKIWKKEVTPPSNPVTQSPSYLFLLDADTPENTPEDRKITDRLYERVWAPHLIDDLVLGVGSVRAARKLGLPIEVWHINDDHGTFNILERLRENLETGMPLKEAREKVKAETVFTTHTPVAGAESKFEREEISFALNALFEGLDVDPQAIWDLGKRAPADAKYNRGGDGKEVFSLTVFAMRHARAINAVSQKHLEISRELWKFIAADGELRHGRGELPLTHVTNAVYAPRWTAKELRGITEETPGKQLWELKFNAKRRAAEQLSHLAFDKRRFDPKALVLCWCRRFTEYKQPTLLVSDLERLARILVNSDKPVYLLMAGKAHPEDPQGQGFVKQVIEASRDPRLEGHLIYFPNYNLTLAKELLTAADVWLNTPVPGWEASGTSGMKAVYNAALNVSTLDGWWAEAFNPSTSSGQVANGWVIDPPSAENLYRLLENEIAPAFYDQKEKWIAMVKESLQSCGEKFDTSRMLEEYRKLYLI
ncbi:MAG: alpha-glucan family phosphorylase [candidate division WWE3 bacterium]|nr:alpha-glucan family phosphorylase [candidate division WWE3 bacterium]